MPHDAYPTQSDLDAFLKAAGADTAAPDNYGKIDFAAKIAAAIERWENDVKWYPALSNRQTRTYDPPGPAAIRSGNFLAYRGGGRILDLDGGLLQLDSLIVGTVPFTQGVLPDMSQGNFWLKPWNAPNQGLPYRTIEFLTPIYGNPEAVQITGTWGRYLKVPDDVWEAILQDASLDCVPELSLGISQGYYQRKIGDSVKTFGGKDDSGPLAYQATMWGKKRPRLITFYKRSTI